MGDGIRSLPRYRHGGPHPEIPRGNYPSIGPTPSWVERVAAQIKSAPRRINRALQPETPGETAALVGASMIPGVGEGIDIADIVAGARTLDLPRVGWGLAGLALPFVAGSSLRKIKKGARKNSLVSPKDLPLGITALGREARKLSRGIARKWLDIRRPIPMDEASVARRLDEQEYLQLFHGTHGRRGRMLKTTEDAPLDPGRVFYQTANPATAEDYGEVIKTYSRAPNQLRFDAEGAPWNAIPLDNVSRHMDRDEIVEFDRLMAEYFPERVSTIDTDNLALIARKMGYSGFDADRLRDAPFSGPVQWEESLSDVPSFVRATLDPGLIRFEGARLDPRDLGKNLPSSGIVGLLGVGAAGAARRNYVERERRDE